MSSAAWTPSAQARAAIERDMPDLAFFDLKLPDGSGLDLLREIKRLQPEVAVVLMTAFGELETAVEAMSAGAYWFMKKPFEQEELLALAKRALESQKLVLELRRLRHQAFSDHEFLHSSSPTMQEAYAIAEQVARGDTTSVLIEGESGTGKEYFANLVHRMSARHAEPFVEIELRRDPRRTARVGAVRSREGRVHRCPRPEAGSLRDGERRHAVPRRDRRHGAACCRSSCCVCSSAARSVASAAPRTSRSTCASSRRRIRTSSGW
jgi:FixJ family two-component response regulator